MHAAINFNSYKPNVVVVDDFYARPDEVRALALQQEFVEDTRYHKGFRTKPFLFPYVRERFQDLLGCEITDWMVQPYNGVFQYCPANTPVVFHSDSQAYAAAVYLTPDAPPNTGTTLYRSRSTGLRAAPTITDAVRTGKTVQELEQETYTGKLLDPSAWEVVDSIGNVYNRLAIWNGKLIHAASGYFGTEPANSRLFQLYFFNVK